MLRKALITQALTRMYILYSETYNKLKDAQHRNIRNGALILTTLPRYGRAGSP